MQRYVPARKVLPQFMLSVLFVVLLGLYGVTPFSGPNFAVAATAVPTSFADLAAQQEPTVVNVYTTQTVKAPSVHQFLFPRDMEIPEPFKRFFGFPDMPRSAPQREMKRTSLGSGVITSADGYILTNNHVVEDADEINVKISTAEEYAAKLIGRDAKTDLALIKIDPRHRLPYVTFGDSDKLRVGDWVIAIGNPFGLEHTVTAGIVSAKGRSISGESYGNFIQTDASINPGNSGGPLFDLDGKMVGINTAIYSRSGGNIGIGFAIPINMAKNVIGQLKEHGKVVRGWLGVSIQQVSADLARSFHLERPVGALVGEVSPGSPAEDAGVRQGDIIIKYKGKEVSQMSMLPAMVAQTPVGKKVKIVLIRNGKEKEIVVKIGKLKEEGGAFGEQGGESGRELGLTLQKLTPDLAKSLSLEDKAGLLISNVEPGSPAAAVGLRRGDLILEINREQVTDLRTYNRIVEKMKKGDSILLLIKREGHTHFVIIKL